MKKYTNKSIIQIEDKIQKKIRGFLKKSECKEITNFLYNDIDYNEIFYIVCNDMNSKDRINFRVFEQLLLNFQQKKRENMLKDTVEKFKAVDSDHDGVINLKQFKELLVLLEIEENYASVLEGIQQLTVSDCVFILSKELVFP